MFALPCEVSADARQDLVLQYQWYAERADNVVAERYLQSFRNTLDLLSEQPTIGRLRKFRHAKLKGIRSSPMLSAFKMHLIFYRLESGRLVIFRVMHGMRDLPRRLMDSPVAET
jgi:plasmid stabilization system protein ParE